MSGLIILTALMVAATMAAAIATARELNILKAKLAKLEEIKQETLQRLEQAIQYRTSMTGTRDMLANLKKFKIEQLKYIAEELERLKAEVIEERDISVSKPVQQTLMEDL